ncbi:ankyrin [Lojkania enalia]|uniref:Ankyrin n=1 Tax=Lojkania enalia TaxID=147567 RepID=A0A9P4JXU4_9PLEO|nr:ankyrin [Didymosphaeria enalia]
MLEYRYSQLSLPTSIRLLRLLPCRQDAKTLRCELFKYHIRDSDTVSHPYKTLSYVWGSEDKPRSIIIDNQNLNVMQNLYVALLRLRNHTCSRIIWVDAVCINQANEEGKGSQIPLMAEIYAKASRVIVWLGETEGDGNRALEAIRLIGEKSAKSPDAEVLQEMTSARHVLIMCGSTEIDGHAFCSDICSLGELVDMYHAHKASRLHDKWRKLMLRLVKFLLGDFVSVNTWDNKETAVLKGKSCVLGRVSKVVVNISWGGGQALEAAFENTSEQFRHRNGCARWTLPTSAKPFQKGDIICLLQRASKPTIIRLCKDHFAVVMIAATPPEHLETKDAPFTRDILLVWGWEITSEEFQVPRKYGESIRKNNLQLYEGTGLEGQLSYATRAWYIALILGDLGEYERAEERLRVAIEGYKRIIGEEHGNTLKGREYGRTPLSLAAENGHDAVVKLLLETGKVDADSKGRYNQTPISWAAGNGHNAMVKLLLETGKVDADSKDRYNQTSLTWAAGNGHDAVVKLLLETGKVDADSKDSEYGRTPLLWAAGNGHDAVVKLLQPFRFV